MLHITQGQIGFRLELIFPIMLVVLSLKIKDYLQVGYVTSMRVLSRLIHLGRLEQ
jgi:hypothetical protein